ncbi:MAG: SDR family oxidoreductase [Rhodovibrionaceae bacterium]
MSAPTVLLTGASRGIGHATAKLFQEKGWRILTLSRQAVSADCLYAEATINHIQADLSNLDEIERLAEQIKRRLTDGKLHAMINNAGISPKGPNGDRLGIATTDAATWAQVINVNLVSIALLARILMPNLQSAKGAIVNVTSIAGSHVHPFAGAAYAVSKAGLSALTRELAHEFGPSGVRANAVSPGEIETSILSPGTDALVNAIVPARRLGTPAEVAESIFFLCGETSSYINGTELHIDGGQHV